MNRANRANERRYRDINAEYDALQGRVQGYIGDLGAQQGADIDRQYRNLGSDTYQRLVGRGLGNSTITGTMAMGVERERQQAYNRLNDQLMRERAQADMQATLPQLQFMENREDVQPNYGQLAGLMQAYGQSGAGQGFGGGGGGYGAQLANSYNQAKMAHLNQMGVFTPQQKMMMAAQQQAFAAMQPLAQRAADARFRTRFAKAQRMNQQQENDRLTRQEFARNQQQAFLERQIAAANQLNEERMQAAINEQASRTYGMSNYYA